MLDTVFGLPLHPLVVHAVVVLLPLVAAGVITLAAVPRWRPRFALLLLGLLGVGTASALVAMASGNELADRVGLPATHQTLGTLLAVSSVGYLIVVGGWLWWVHSEETEPTSQQNAAGWVLTGLSGAILVLTVLVGHSGSAAVWSGVLAEPAAPGTRAPTSTASVSTTPAPSPTPSTFPSGEDYTMAAVEERATASSCWIAVDGLVYDVTEWIPRHPGGADRIIPLCGTDATSAFSEQHGDAPDPNQQLSQFLLGPLS